MDLFSILTMIGGLALFLYGMHIMGEGLSKLSGGKLERILEKLTDSPLKGVILGAAVTAVIQSSSATTVMVVGFVNSGIMRLTQAISIIMGANIGTTVTSWILSLAGIESENIFIQLLKPTSFAPVFAMIGAALILFTKKDKKKDIGTILIGFAILMMGMDTMSGAVKPLADVPEFTNILTMFSNPILGMIAGAVLTAIIQSSSASVGILQALCATNALQYGTALPVIMGQNIGTCITAIISGIGANRNAKRAAIVHLYFNLIGTVVFMIVFYTLNVFVNFTFLDTAANATGIAVIHSVFNVTATLVLLPFSSLLEKLAYLTIKDDNNIKDEDEPKDDIMVLDPRFLEKPSFAVEQCKNVAIRMAEVSRESLFKAMDLIDNYDEKEAQEVCVLEEAVDKYEDELGTYMVKLSSKNLSQKDSRLLSTLLHCISDFERISDHAVNVMENAREKYEKKLSFSPHATEEMKVLQAAIRDIVNMSFEVFANQDAVLAHRIEPLEEVIDDLNDTLKQKHINRLRQGKCTIEMGFVMTDLTTNFERVADHCSNIGVCLIQIKEDGYDTHEYLDRLKRENDGEFIQRYSEYKEKYRITYND